MAVIPKTQQLLSGCLLETTIVPVIPSVPDELNNLLSTVLERLLHPQLITQVFSDTLLLNSLTRKCLAEEMSRPLVYAQRRLAVFELGLQAMLICSDFKREERNSLFEKIDLERAIWEERVWQLLVESGEYRHIRIGFSNQKM